jgi:hypothetical protein
MRFDDVTDLVAHPVLKVEATDEISERGFLGVEPETPASRDAA